MSRPPKENLPAPVPTIWSGAALDQAFSTMLVDIASVPIRDADQADSGVLNRDGLSLSVIRRIALRWCARILDRSTYGRGDIEALIMTIEDSTDGEFREMIEDAAAYWRR